MHALPISSYFTSYEVLYHALQHKIFSSVSCSQRPSVYVSPLIESGYTLIYKTAHYLVVETEQMHKIFSIEPVFRPKSESMMYQTQSMNVNHYITLLSCRKR
jgi:hypothetical protein